MFINFFLLLKIKQNSIECVLGARLLKHFVLLIKEKNTHGKHLHVITSHAKNNQNHK